MSYIVEMLPHLKVLHVDKWYYDDDKICDLNSFRNLKVAIILHTAMLEMKCFHDFVRLMAIFECANVVELVVDHSYYQFVRYRGYFNDREQHLWSSGQLQILAESKINLTELSLYVLDLKDENVLDFIKVMSI